MHNQSTTALHQAENIPKVLFTPNNGTIPLALFYRDLTSVVESCAEAVAKDGAGDTAGDGVTKGVVKVVLGAGGSCWLISSMAVGGDDVAVGGSCGEAMVAEVVVMGCRGRPKLRGINRLTTLIGNWVATLLGGLL